MRLLFAGCEQPHPSRRAAQIAQSIASRLSSRYTAMRRRDQTYAGEQISRAEVGRLAPSYTYAPK